MQQKEQIVTETFVYLEFLFVISHQNQNMDIYE